MSYEDAMDHLKDEADAAEERVETLQKLEAECYAWHAWFSKAKRLWMNGDPCAKEFGTHFLNASPYGAALAGPGDAKG